MSRESDWERISAMAGLSPEGAILPPPPGTKINRGPVVWWSNHYRTVGQTWHANAARHLSNAIGYANKGWASHSDGSIRKAIRNFKRAQQLDQLGI